MPFIDQHSSGRPYQVRAKTACEAVGLDRDRFNEEASAGIYPCAPSAEPGRARIFYEPDLIALWVYARLRDMGVLAVQAGVIACRVGEQARQLFSNNQPIKGDVVIGFDQAGSSYCTVRKVDKDGAFNIAAQLDGTSNAYGGTYSSMVISFSFALGNVLQIVKDRVEELTAPQGED